METHGSRVGGPAGDREMAFSGGKHGDAVHSHIPHTKVRYSCSSLQSLLGGEAG